MSYEQMKTGLDAPGHGDMCLMEMERSPSVKDDYNCSSDQCLIYKRQLFCIWRPLPHARKTPDPLGGPHVLYIHTYTSTRRAEHGKSSVQLSGIKLY